MDLWNERTSSVPSSDGSNKIPRCTWRSTIPCVQDAPTSGQTVVGGIRDIHPEEGYVHPEPPFNEIVLLSHQSRKRGRTSVLLPFHYLPLTGEEGTTCREWDVRCTKDRLPHTPRRRRVPNASGDFYNPRRRKTGTYV